MGNGGGCNSIGHGCCSSWGQKREELRTPRTTPATTATPKTTTFDTIAPSNAPLPLANPPPPLPALPPPALVELVGEAGGVVTVVGNAVIVVLPLGVEIGAIVGVVISVPDEEKNTLWLDVGEEEEGGREEPEEPVGPGVAPEIESEARGAPAVLHASSYCARAS